MKPEEIRISLCFALFYVITALPMLTLGIAYSNTAAIILSAFYLAWSGTIMVRRIITLFDEIT
jgi:hypothetical protein